MLVQKRLRGQREHPDRLAATAPSREPTLRMAKKSLSICSALNNNPGPQAGHAGSDASIEAGSL